MDILYKKFKNHYIICGFDSISRGICYKLKEENVPFVIIDSDEKSFEYANLRNYEIINDEPANDATLIAAGIENAAGLVTCTSSDSDNLYITLAAKELKPDLHIISCSSNPSKKARMKRAGANIVVFPEYLGGQEIAKLICNNTPSQNITKGHSTTSSLDGYSLKVYRHLDEAPSNILDILSKTKALTAVALLKNGNTIYGYNDETVIHQNDSIILAIDENNIADKDA